MRSQYSTMSSARAKGTVLHMNRIFLSRRSWIYLLPTIHALIALFAVIGLALRQNANYPNRAWDFLYFVDFPLSLGTVFLVFGPQILAALWVVIVCTWWWYLLSRGIDKVIRLIGQYIRRY